MKFNENLKYLRKQAGLTQEQLAEKLNVSRQAITKWESGQSFPDIENLKEIS
ncbi:MAG TPA: transcriptional regulator, partial [Clostridiales bacterium]|nr:transcriptional regulator [Clostridiales bacterium]